MLFWLSISVAFAQGFDDAFEEEDTSSEEMNEAEQAEIELISKLEDCKETPETNECQEFFIQYGEDLGVDLEQYVLPEESENDEPIEQTISQSLEDETDDSSTEVPTFGIDIVSSLGGGLGGVQAGIDFEYTTNKVNNTESCGYVSLFTNTNVGMVYGEVGIMKKKYNKKFFLERGVGLGAQIEGYDFGARAFVGSGLQVVPRVAVKLDAYLGAYGMIGPMAGVTLRTAYTF